MFVPAIFRENLFDDMMDDFFRRPFMTDNDRQIPQFMKTDVKESDTDYELEVDIPGYNKDDITLDLKDGCLSISAAKNVENNEKDENGHYIRRERFSGNMTRSFYVGEDVKQEDIKAKFENGILHVRVPKVNKNAKIETPSHIKIEG